MLFLAALKLRAQSLAKLGLSGSLIDLADEVALPPGPLATTYQ
jgi:hypothetical protein